MVLASLVAQVMGVCQPKHGERKGFEESTNHTHDWEVLSITALSYATTQGPKSESRTKNKSDVNVNENESPTTMVHSGHLIFPPSHHEGIPIQLGIGKSTEGLEISYDVTLQKVERLMNLLKTMTLKFTSVESI